MITEQTPKLFEDKDIEIYSGTLSDLQKLAESMGLEYTWSYGTPILNEKGKIIRIDRETISMYAYSGCHVIHRVENDEWLLFINKKNPDVWKFTKDMSV